MKENGPFEMNNNVEDKATPILGGILPGFDNDYYVANNSDVDFAKVSPLQHYLTVGWKEGRNPSDGFDGNAYLDINPDVREAGHNPLIHFLNWGICEGRGWRKVEIESSSMDDGNPMIPGFDEAYYREHNKDLSFNDISPLQHYMEKGWKEGRRPSLGFDGDAYLELHPDVKAAGCNPLMHYIAHGITEGRSWIRMSPLIQLSDPTSVDAQDIYQILQFILDELRRR